ncbi:MAG: Gfo/Idh/MocA family oxidoreductase [candidate division Zixibacteria bacterium]|nr:Gfo/Idh/MocA family oxidoreductase [candidate division Zixibacteria bacterium]
MPHPVLRVAIGGQGRSGYSIHAQWLRQIPQKYRIVAVADALPERREDASREFGARTYADWSDLLADDGFDLFVNALPTPFHVPATLAALEAGKHVLCEKPMADRLENFDRMVDAAHRNGLVLSPFQNNRPQPFFEKMQEILASGVIGKIVYIRSTWGNFARRWDWQTLQKNMGGGLRNTGPHAIDQALALFGYDRTPHVFCRMDCNNPFGGDADDHCTVTLYDPERIAPQIDILVSGYMAYPQGDMYTVYGTYGGLSGGFDTLRWKYFDPLRAPKQEMWGWSVDQQYPQEELPWEERTWSLTEEQNRPASGYTLRSLQSGPEKIYENLYDVITEGGTLLIPLEQVRVQIAVLEECLRQNPLPVSG